MDYLFSVAFPEADKRSDPEPRLVCSELRGMTYYGRAIRGDLSPADIVQLAKEAGVAKFGRYRLRLDFPCKGLVDPGMAGERVMIEEQLVKADERCIMSVTIGFTADSLFVECVPIDTKEPKNFAPAPMRHGHRSTVCYWLHAHFLWIAHMICYLNVMRSGFAAMRNGMPAAPADIQDEAVLMACATIDTGAWLADTPWLGGLAQA